MSRRTYESQIRSLLSDQPTHCFHLTWQSLCQKMGQMSHPFCSVRHYSGLLSSGSFCFVRMFVRRHLCEIMIFLTVVFYLWRVPWPGSLLNKLQCHDLERMFSLDAVLSVQVDCLIRSMWGCLQRCRLHYRIAKINIALKAHALCSLVYSVRRLSSVYPGLYRRIRSNRAAHSAKSKRWKAEARLW